MKEKLTTGDISRILELQDAEKYVTKTTKKFIAKLDSIGMVKYKRDGQGKIIAAFYVLPLNDELAYDAEEQIYRFGGLSSESKNDIMILMLDYSNEAQAKNISIIMKIGNKQVRKLFCEWDDSLEELTYKECKKKYPEYLERAFLLGEKTAKCFDLCG